MVHSDEIDLPTSLGYLLKEAATALRVAMEDALRPLELTVTAYSCLEILAQRPGSSNSDLARGAFVTRQSMNVLLQTLEREGLVTRPATPPEGRVLPVTLTDAGLRRREQASAVVKSVEDRMLAELSAQERAQAFDVLTRMTRALREA
ncbi:MarR family winged helix-turn-helix transcriptional regulator [Microbacterium sp. 179-I 1D1 NHS]|uniref:MarR family winged helix-turn-helix transcriptional regulator n=1 Tax=Microbacterium sp. 179-I 1D1 NHS TaxID=3374298 RepID=UPI003879C0EC